MLMGYAEGPTARSAPRRLCVQDDQWCNRVRVLHVIGVLASGSALLSLCGGVWRALCAAECVQRRLRCGFSTAECVWRSFVWWGLWY
mgnify:FL=1